jgi:uncharacterized repeat protein (TIGR01451 family)
MSPRRDKALPAVAGAVLALVAIAAGAPIAAAHPGRNVHHRSTTAHHVLRRRPANLALRLTGSPGTVNTGEQVTYTATVVNTGGRTDGDARFRNLVPAKASLVSTSPSRGSCGGGRMVVCRLGPLPRGASATITIVVTANQPGPMTDYAWVSTTPPGHWWHRHAVTTTVQGGGANVDLKLTESPPNVDVGRQVTYTATVADTGNAAAPAVAFQDLLPAKATLVSASASQGSCSGNPVVLCNLGSLDAGASATVTIVVTASRPGRMTDGGWVSDSPPGHWRHHHAVTVYVHRVSPDVGLRLSASPRNVDSGQQATFTATVANRGNGTATTVAFQDLLPGKATLVSATPSQGTCSGSPTVVCDLGSLNAGASATVTIVVTANQPGWMTDHGWVSVDPPGNWQHHRSASVYVHRVNANVDLSLDGSPATVDPGQQVTYTATVGNHGNGTAPTVAFQDLLPGRASLVSTSPSQGSCSGDPVVVCNLGSLDAGARATVTIVVTASQPGRMTDHGWVSVNPPGSWQHERTVNTDVRNVSPQLALRLSGSPGSVTVGQQVTYTATVTDTGRGIDANAGFEEMLPAGTTLVSATASQGTCSGAPTLTCDLGSISPGGSATIAIVVTADQPGTIVDRGWVSTNPPGGWEHGHLVATDVRPAPAPTTTASHT